MRKKHKQAHTSAPRGRRIRVVLKNGTEFVDKFIERGAHDVIFEGRTVAAADIKSFTIWRDPDANRPCCGKIDYGSQETAVKSARAMTRKKKEEFEAYRCEEGRWHIGHAPESITITLNGKRIGEQIEDALRKVGMEQHLGAVKRALKKAQSK